MIRPKLSLALVHLQAVQLPYMFIVTHATPAYSDIIAKTVSVAAVTNVEMVRLGGL